MALSSTIIIQNIPILFERSKRARKISISIKPFRGVRVAVPLSVSFSQAEGAVSQKISWIRHHSAKMKTLEATINRNSLKSIEIDRPFAQKKLITRLQELADRHGYQFNKVCIRNQKTRWGSCSAQNNISLNMKLTLLPDHLIDFVLLHELVHTRIKNHGEHFWAELSRLIGDQDLNCLRRQMKQYGLRVL